MSFLIGFSFSVILALFSFLLWLIASRLSEEFVFTVIFFMIIGDLVLVGLWYYGLMGDVSNLRHFRLGISGAFCFTSFARSIFYLLKNS